MGFVSRYWDGLKREAGHAARAFMPGSSAPFGAQYWGIDQTEFGPPEYGDYIATSNGVYACTRLRATLLASLPLKLYKIAANGDKADVPSGDLVALLQKVNPFWTFSRLVEMTEMSLCLWGEAFWFLNKTTGGKPAEIWWARSDHVRVVPDPNTYVRGFLYDPGNGTEPISYDPSEVIWFRYPNPLNSYAGLAPLAAARIAADTANAAMHSNRNIFRQGMQIGGTISPASKDQTFSEQQVGELQVMLRKGFSGTDKAHRWVILRSAMQFNPMALSPKDAEFLGAMKWSLEEIARAYQVPQDLVGGQRTYENVNAARIGLWEHTMRPEARFIATELTEQLLPLFPGQADMAEFDLSGVPVLQEAASDRWARWRDQIDIGARVLNEYRSEEGLDPVPWGDVWWAQTAGGGVAPILSPNAPLALNAAISAGAMTINEYRASQNLPDVPWGNAWWAPPGHTPIEDAEPPEPPTPEPLPKGGAGDDSPTAAGPDGEAPERGVRSIFGDDDHQRAWEIWTRRIEPHERNTERVVRDLFRRQEASIIARLEQRSIGDINEAPFDMARWIKAFRVALRPVLREIVGDVGGQAFDDLALGLAFDVLDPNVIRAMERQTQRFAKEVNQTTWDELRAVMTEGLTDGEDIPTIADRIRAVMQRRKGDATMIARTEVTAASTGGTIESWRQSGVVVGKRWLAALDDRTRLTHVSAHSQFRDLDADFTVGSGTGPGPGLINVAGESVNCRCTLTPVLDVDMEGR